MLIQINRTKMVEALSKLAAVPPRSKSLSILQSVHMDASSGGKLTLTCADVNEGIWASVTIDCDITGHGHTTLPISKMLGILKLLGNEDVVLRVGAEVVAYAWATSLSAGNFTSLIKGYHPDDFPRHSYPDVGQSCVSAAEFSGMVKKVFPTISTDDARPNLTGAFMQITLGMNLLMASTDGHRLSKTESSMSKLPVTTEAIDLLQAGVIVPRKALDIIRKTLPEACDGFSFSLHEGAIVFRYGSMVVSARLIDGTFPDYTQALPRHPSPPAIIDRRLFAKTLKAVSVFTSKKHHTARLTLNPGSLKIYASCDGSGEATETIPCQYDGPEVKAGYNYKYLLNVLKTLQGDDVSMEIIDTLSPTTFREIGQEDSLFIVMPMRL